jgi:hypothetical protein
MGGRPVRPELESGRELTEGAREAVESGERREGTERAGARLSFSPLLSPYGYAIDTRRMSKLSACPASG